MTRGRTLQTYLSNPQTEQERQIAELGPWFHNLHLPDETQTAPDHPLGDFPSFKWRQIEPHLPADLSGWSVLDIGCNAGFYSFELARRGARVTAIDLNPHYLRQAQWAARQFGLEAQIEFHQMQVYALAHVEDTYDIVWFMGVLYHLRYPLLALDIVARKMRRMLVFQTLMSPGEEVTPQPFNLTLDEIDSLTEPGWPKLAFIENRFEGDPTNWWAPNHACIESMLRSCGVEPFVRPAEGIYLCKPIPGSEAVKASTAEMRAATGR